MCPPWPYTPPGKAAVLRALRSCGAAMGTDAHHNVSGRKGVPAYVVVNTASMVSGPVGGAGTGGQARQAGSGSSSVTSLRRTLHGADDGRQVAANPRRCCRPLPGQPGHVLNLGKGQTAPRTGQGRAEQEARRPLRSHIISGPGQHPAAWGVLRAKPLPGLPSPRGSTNPLPSPRGLTQGTGGRRASSCGPSRPPARRKSDTCTA